MLQRQRLQRWIVKVSRILGVKASHVIDDAFAGLYKRKNHKVDLLILDDFFPAMLSAFRITEYNHYLQNIASAEVHTSRASNLFFNSSGSYEEKLQEYSSYYPEFKVRIKKYNKKRIPLCKLVYTVFINNAYSFIDDIDRYNIPFAFTLYPGGGFNMHDAEADHKLRRVLSSPNFRKVFVTQKITEQYLLDKRYCKADDIVFIYGCVLPCEQLSRLPVPKRRFQVEKETFDICFVAAKYTPRGVDKGYDVFIEVARKLCQRHSAVRFHVVGSFDASDIDVSAMADRITFHGLRNTDFFPDFYSGMDIVLSPNVPFVLAPGAFDGFPTGSCMEAGLCGVAVFCSDPLQLNIAFKDKEEIVIIPRDAGEIAEMIGRYYQRTDELYQIAENGKKAFLRTFNLAAQMTGRMKIIEQLLQESGPEW